MNMRDKLAGEIEDPALAEALNNFKASVNAWSEAAYNRPRTVVNPARSGWRLATGLALGCVLAAGSLAGGVYEWHHRQDLARIAAMKATAQKIAQERAAAAQSATANAAAKDKDEDLLATVDSDVSREVPAAMEPLAQLMDENGTSENRTR